MTLCRENSALSDLLTEAQTVLGRTISTAEQEMLVNMHIYYELPPEVILMLLGYYRGEKEKGRSINLAYINKMANSWSEDGVRTVADADEKLLYLSGTDKLWDKVIAMTGIRHRSPTARQRQMVADWGRDFSEDMLQLACDIMKENADKPSLKYMDSVLRRWKKGADHPRPGAGAATEFYRRQGQKSRRPPARQALLRPGADQERHHE